MCRHQDYTFKQKLNMKIKKLKKALACPES